MSNPPKLQRRRMPFFNVQYYARIETMSNQPQKVVFDIETIGESFDSLDHATQEQLTRWIRRESVDDEEYKIALEDMKNGLGFSPLTGEIVAIGLLDYYKNEGVVYFQAPGEKNKEFFENGITFKQFGEKEMLQKFWDGARQYHCFITFNGRGFDVPFLVVRSAIHGIRPTKDLMRGRYLYQHNADAIHIDLQDQLTFYGAVRRKGSLHLWSRAFGIESPKVSGITGDDVGRLFKEKRFLDIAKYNVGDLRATRDLYTKWDQYLNF
jgi:DNA polymerase III epsilon subunit-like protein